MRDSEVVANYMELSKRLEACGVVLLIRNDAFQMNVKKANGIVSFENLEDLERFTRGYELGYKLGL